MSTLSTFNIINVPNAYACVFFDETGIPHSKHLQKTGGLRGLTGESLQYNCVVIWLDAEREVVEKRMDGRVDKMIVHGLLPEIQQLYMRAFSDGRCL